jgi:nicotinamidase-related amidase
LLLIDRQNDYFPGGKMELEGSEKAAEMANRLLEFFRKKQLSIFHVQHLSIRPGATFFIPHTLGVEFHTQVKPRDGETMIPKHFPNGFRETDLLLHLQQQGIRRLVMAGMMTHMCVDATIRSAADLGFECLIAGDACATRKLIWNKHEVSAADVQSAFLAVLNVTYGRVSNVNTIIEELQTGSGK